ncbi:MAG: hydroxyphenylacetyl-CoA thioesterase PaaI [Polyangiaceae bacterium]|nr:hydroxyphenylacetyl-CoA thioesterase PaaI [Polyangiaceae bacterium]
MSEPSPEQIAELVGRGMFANDPASQGMGMQLTRIAPGRATMTMTVRESMLNGHQTCQGGFLATLADSAFAFACNSYNEMTVASSFSIDFMAPARLDDVLTATCLEVSKAGRTGVYDTEVTNQRNERIAVFRGRSYTIKGRPAFAALPPAALSSEESANGHDSTRHRRTGSNRASQP